MFNRIREEQGFTLIELLVVILIIGILIAVAAPSFLGQQDKAQASKLEQEMAVSYKAVKADSVSGSYSAVAFDTGATEVYDITASEPKLIGLVSSPATMPANSVGQSLGTIYLSGTATDFHATAWTPAGTKVVYDVPSTGAVGITTSPNS